MRFARRTFLWSFLPVAALLLGSFWAVERAVVSTVRDGLRTSLRDRQTSIERMRLNNERQNSRSLRAVSENAALKAGLQLILQDPNNAGARLTVEDQWRELCETIGFDLLVVSDLDGKALAGVVRTTAGTVVVPTKGLRPPKHGFFFHEGIVYQVTSVPVDQGDQNIAVLAVGERFDFAALSTSAVLLAGPNVLQASLPRVQLAEIQAALNPCHYDLECEIRLGGQTYVSLAMNSVNLGDGYTLRSLQNLDSAVAPVQSVLRHVFLVAGTGALIAVLILTALSSRSIVEPIARVIEHLRASEKTGILPHFDASLATVQEIRELTQTFNRAAEAVSTGREDLHRAYVECVGSLASALDARDQYTAGHSRRVSDFSSALAEAIGLNGQELETLRVGALLHDIGKIGIPDSVLQKVGPLTNEEFALIKEHPAIGRRILEGVNGLAPYLPTVELHHENWDGSGYPHGLRGDETPLGARIVHVADAYDAMTSDRPYRKGMRSEDAVRIIQKHAGTQFDPRLAEVFARLAEEGKITSLRREPDASSLANLATAVGTTSPALSEVVQSR